MQINKPILYLSPTGSIELQLDQNTETIWASQAQIAEAFEMDIRTINEHIKNIYNSGELSKDSTLRSFRIVQKEWSRSVERNIRHYNLDTILSVGYRVNSIKATKFRKWATTTLKKHLIDGYTINKSRISENYTEFLRAVEDIKALLPRNRTINTESTLELISAFADTWLSLDAYDRDILITTGVTQSDVRITADELVQALFDFKQALIIKWETTDLFGTERQIGSLSGIVGNIFQSWDGQDLYPSVEDKSAYLLYFIVKNHPFADGNKRSGAYAFIWFLARTGRLDTHRITPPALTALTLLIAESDPKNKDRMIRLILQLLW